MGGKIALFVASGTETGITQLEFDPGRLGMTGSGTTGNAGGTARDGGGMTGMAGRRSCCANRPARHPADRRASGEGRA